MKTINRIMLSSTCLILLSLILLIVGSVTVLLLLPIKPAPEKLDKDIFSIEKILNSFQNDSEDWNALDAQLSEYNYKLLVCAGGNTVYSSLDDWGQSADYLKQIMPVENLVTGTVDNMTFVAKPVGAYSILASKRTYEDNEGLTEFLLPFSVLLLLFIALIVFLGRFFTRKMAWRVLRPLGELANAAKRVEDGDLSMPIVYTGNDEFSSVCKAFNHMQEYLRDEREKNVAYERARVDLIAGISHDLRTPLTSVKGFIKGLRDGVAKTPEKREQYLSIAYDKACHMDVLLQKLFYFSNLETGQLPITPTNEDLGLFVRKFINSVQSELSMKNIKIAADITSVPHPVKIDTEQMRRILINLTENAVKYAQNESLKLKISVWRENNMEHLMFADNGDGVPDEYLPYLFERFWRGDESRRIVSGDGNGLGLYICKYIVDSHGGMITAKNDNGLQIQISLPCRKEEST